MEQQVQTQSAGDWWESLLDFGEGAWESIVPGVNDALANLGNSGNQQQSQQSGTSQQTSTGTQGQTQTSVPSTSTMFGVDRNTALLGAGFLLTLLVVMKK